MQKSCQNTCRSQWMHFRICLIVSFSHIPVKSIPIKCPDASPFASLMSAFKGWTLCWVVRNSRQLQPKRAAFFHQPHYVKWNIKISLILPRCRFKKWIWIPISVRRDVRQRWNEQSLSESNCLLHQNKSHLHKRWSWIAAARPNQYWALRHHSYII